jgi:glutathione S-transferase
MRKINDVIKALDEFVRKSNGGHLIAEEFTIADIAAGAFLGMANMVEEQFGFVRWKEQYPELVRYWEMLEDRKSFRQTQPYMFELTEKVA